MDSPTTTTNGLSRLLPEPKSESLGPAKVRLSIFSRLAIGCLAIVLVMGAVNLYALFQLRELTELSTQLVSYHYPAIAGAKRLLSSLYAQLRSEKQYLAVHDVEFVSYFKEESEEFRRAVESMLAAEQSDEGRELLHRITHLQATYRDGFLKNQGRLARNVVPAASGEYERGRDALIERINVGLESYIKFHEEKVSTVISDSRASSAQAEAVTRQLVLLAVAVGLGFAGLASYSILRPLRRIQNHIQKIGQGTFGTTVQIEAPSDLTELVEAVNWMAKKLQELEDMKQEFFAHVSHELRTPLASIQEGTQLLLDEIPGRLTGEQRETLRIMAASSRRLIHLISTILDLSKMEAGMMEYRIVLSDLLAIADTSVSKIRLLADAKNVQIVAEAPEERVFVPADAARMEQVLDNLLSNALKFSPAGGVVRLQMHPDRRAQVVRIVVSDNGPGIAQDDLPYLFERFYQGRRQAGSGMAGSGLGLALAKKVVEAHHGDIWVESELGKGTTVHVVLPQSRTT